MSSANPLHPPSNQPLGLLDKLLGFFFQPTSAHTLVPIRIATGLMIAYVHCVWLLKLDDFLGPNALVSNELWNRLHGGAPEIGVPGDSKWTYLAMTESLSWIRLHEWLGVLCGVCAALGLLTRLTMGLAWFLTLMTVHRLTGFLFGLDQIVIMLSFYLIFAQSNSLLSLDSILSKRFPKLADGWWLRIATGLNTHDLNAKALSWQNTVSTRMMQIHLCIIYFFGGLGKLRGEMWWDGSALWFAAASYEYQSNDLTWMGRYPVLVAVLTHVTLFWEVLYPAIVWPKWTRPVALLLAVAVHSGIAMFMGMITFGFMMIIANLSFVPADLMHRTCQAARRLPTPKS
jgi:hypothetical protein